MKENHALFFLSHKALINIKNQRENFQNLNKSLEDLSALMEEWKSNDLPASPHNCENLKIKNK